MEKHPIDIAKEKFCRHEDITICMVVKNRLTEGVVWKGLYYPDDRFEGLEGQKAYVITSAENGFIYLFTESGRFACGYKVGAGCEFQF